MDHPNIVKMYDYGVKGTVVGDYWNFSDVWFIVLEYISEMTMINLVGWRGCLT